MNLAEPEVSSAPSAGIQNRDSPVKSCDCLDCEIVQYYEFIAASMPDAVYTRDENGTILSVNRAAQELFGYTAAEMIGKPITMLLAKPHPPIQEIRERGQHSELIGLHKSGRTMPLSFSLGSFMRGPKRILTAVVRDETERRQARMMLAASEQKYRSLVENVEDIIFQTDDQGAWTFLNPVWEKITGFSVPESLGKPFVSFIHPDDRLLSSELFEALIAQRNEHWRQEVRYLTHAGDVRWLNVSARVMCDSEGGHVLGATGILNDVTHYRKVEDELRVAKEAAEYASRAKDEFLSRVSHELRTPMHSILGFAQLLEFDELSTEQEENVGRILKAGRHLQNLLNDILDISRIESGRLAIELERLDPLEALRSAVELVQPLLTERQITLRMDLMDRPTDRVLADRQRLMQVFLNLLTNAAKYNRVGGEVILSHARVNGSRLRISVTDTGDGISAENQAKLFQPFERLDATRTKIPGTGLGLALTKRMIELMKGTIGVESSPGVGSTFWVELPNVEPVFSLGSPEAGRIAGQAPHTVLYIEDDLTNIVMVQGVFELFADVRFITSMLGSIGVEMARLHTPSLILLDLHLPDICGSEVLQQLRAHPRTASIPVVVLTADSLPSTEYQMREAGARAFLRKPIDVRQLMEIARPILEKARQ